MDTEKLKAANIPESWWPDCYISSDGIIFTSDYDKSGTMIKTGEQTYNEWLANKDQAPEPTIADRVKALEAAQLAALGV